MTDARRTWRVKPGQLLARREWDGEAVLFNDLTGATHLLSSTALWLIERLRAMPADAAVLAQALDAALQAEANAAADTGEKADTGTAARAGIADGMTDPAEVAALLHDLHKMHLIEPC